MSAQLLFESKVLKEFQPDAQLKHLFTSISSQQAHSLSTFLLQTATNQLLQKLQRTPLTYSVPFALLQQLPHLTSSWKISTSPDCKSFAIWTDEVLYIRTQMEQIGEALPRENLIQHITEKDTFQKWRKMSWSPDSKYLCFASSSGKIDIINRMEEMPIFTILPSSVGTLNQKSFFIDPLSVLIVVGDLEKIGRAVYENERYEYELITIRFDGHLKSYLFRPPTENIFSPRDLEPFSIQQEEHTNSDLTFHHHFTFPNLNAVLDAIYDSERHSLFIAGKAKSLIDDQGHKYTPSHISLWKLIPMPPYFIPWHAPKSFDLDYFNKDEKINQNGESLLTSFWNSFMNWRKRRDEFMDGMLMKLSFNGEHIMSLNWEGKIQFWDLNKKIEEGQMLFDYSEMLVDQWDSNDYDFQKEDSKIKVKNCFYWKNDVIALFFSDGTYLMLSDDKEILLPSRNLEKNTEFGQIINHSVLYILECESKMAQAKVLPNGTLLDLKLKNSVSDSSESIKKESKSWIRGFLDVLYHPIDFLTSSFLWHWETNNEQQTFEVEIRHFLLSSMTESSPEDLLNHYLSQNKFTEAFDLCEKYRLSHLTDQIYKQQWLNMPIGEESLKGIFEKIKDEDWKLEQTRKRECDNYEEQLLLYQYALNKTKQPPIVDQKKKLLDQQDEAFEKYCLIRYETLQSLQRLYTFQQLSSLSLHNHSISFDFKKEFHRFKNVLLPDQCMYYAQLSLFDILKVIFDRHKAEVWDDWFFIIDCVPCSVHPILYVDLLKKLIEEQNTTVNEPLDWVETEEYLELLPQDCLSPHHVKKEKTVYTKEDLQNWFIKRCLKIDTQTGRLDLSNSLLYQAEQKYDFQFGRLRKIVYFLYTFLYDNYTSTIDNVEFDVWEIPETVIKIGLKEFKDYFENKKFEELILFGLKRGLSLWKGRDTLELAWHDYENHILEWFKFITDCNELEVLQSFLSNTSESKFEACFVLLSRKDLIPIELVHSCLESVLLSAPTSDLNLCLQIWRQYSDLFDKENLLYKIMSSIEIMRSFIFNNEMLMPNAVSKSLKDPELFSTRLIRLAIQSVFNDTTTPATSPTASRAKKFLSFISPLSAGSKTAASPILSQDFIREKVELRLDQIFKLHDALLSKNITKKHLIMKFISELLSSVQTMEELNSILPLLKIWFFKDSIPGTSKPVIVSSVFNWKTPSISQEKNTSSVELSINEVETILYNILTEWIQNAHSADKRNNLQMKMSVLLFQQLIPGESLERMAGIKDLWDWIELLHALMIEHELENYMNEQMKTGLLPIQVMLEKNRVKILEWTLSINRNYLYKKKRVVLDLLERLLHFQMPPLQISLNFILSKVLIHAALEHDDFRTALGYAQDLIQTISDEPQADDEKTKFCSLYEVFQYKLLRDNNEQEFIEGKKEVLSELIRIWTPELQSGVLLHDLILQSQSLFPKSKNEEIISPIMKCFILGQPVNFELLSEK